MFVYCKIMLLRRARCHPLHSQIGHNYVTKRLYVEILMVHHVAAARNGSDRTLSKIQQSYYRLLYT
jgi:hypothetical protein